MPTATPELPAGWLRCETSDHKVYYWNAALSISQWEHPQHSYLSGVATRLTHAVARVRKAAAAAEAAEEARALLERTDSPHPRSRRSSM